MAYEVEFLKIRTLLPALILVLILPISASSPAPQASPDCRPLTLPVGTEPEVISKAAEFLIKVETVQVHPYWPGGKSGVTIGIGWDLGYHNVSELRSAWAKLGDSTLHRLDMAAGKKGEAAQSLISQFRSINVPADVSKQVLANSLQTYYYPFVTSHFPGLTRLPAEAQVVLISLVFNRGISMGHEPDWSLAKEVDSRWEFRELHRDAQDGDLFAIYTHLGTMKRLWEASGGQGLRIRRRDEQALIRPYVDKQLQWEKHCGNAAPIPPTGLTAPIK
jgi:hypothetical protein